MHKVDLMADWILSGDRSHPNLKLVDNLRTQITYDGHSSDIDSLERAHIEGDTHTFEHTLFKIKELENMYYADRSHPHLVQLDSLRPKLTYDGWKKDFKRAEQIHVGSHELITFSTFIEGMKRKQAKHIGDRSHSDLRYLDSLRLTYPGWQNDVTEANEKHLRGYDICKIDKFCLTEKQKMHEGKRSHPRLVALDNCARSFDYLGWKKDVKETEKKHVTYIGGFAGQPGVSTEFTELLKSFDRKQKKHNTGVEDFSTMHPIQCKIIKTKWDYPGWKKDMDEIRKCYHSSQFEDYLETCQLKQAVYYGKNLYNHPALSKLDSMSLSYPGWKKDIKEAKACLSQWGYKLFIGKGQTDKIIRGIEIKQKIFDGPQKEICCICHLDMMQSRDSTVKTIKCGHMLHSLCFDQLIQHVGSISHAKCPLCRGALE
jgi:hypothetical protein